MAYSPGVRCGSLPDCWRVEGLAGDLFELTQYFVGVLDVSGRSIKLVCRAEVEMMWAILKSWRGAEPASLERVMISADPAAPLLSLRSSLEGEMNATSRNSAGWRYRLPLVSNDVSGQQTASSHLRQADDLLLTFDAAAERYPRDSSDIDAA